MLLIVINAFFVIALSFIAMTFLYIVFGELIPKSIAIGRAEVSTKFTVWPLLYVFCKLGSPITILFNKATKALLVFWGFKPAIETELAHPEKGLQMSVSVSQRNAVLAQIKNEMIVNVFDFIDRLAREIMIPRQDMTCLFIGNSFEETIQVMWETGYTCYPLCIKDKDHVIGMVHIRDLINMQTCSTGERDLRRVVQEVLAVPESLPAAQVLQLMRNKRTYLAVVIDEYGGTAGFVTLKNVLEEIVGDIRGKHDGKKPEIQHYSDGSIEFDGRVLLDDVENWLNVHLERYKEATIGGYIFRLLGRKPVPGDEVSLGGYIFAILQVNGFRVVRVKTMLNVNGEKERSSLDYFSMDN